MSTLVKKIIFRDNDRLDKLYFGNELIFYTEPEPVELDYLTFTAIEPSTILYKPSDVTTAEYSYDKVNWNSADNVTLNLNTGDKVYFKGNITGDKAINEANFKMTGKISASGSIMSLQEGNPNDKTIKYGYAFRFLFLDCTSLVTAPELPATVLTKYCYSHLFSGCKNLVKAPYLPAKKLKTGSYEFLFYKCSKLNYIKCDIRSEIYDNTINWVAGVASTGDFYCYNPKIFKTGNRGIPNGWRIHSEIEPTKEYDVVYVSGRYNFSIPKKNGGYYVIDSDNDCEVDVITDKDFTSLNEMLIGSNDFADVSEWELFFNKSKLYLDLGNLSGYRLSCEFGEIKKDTVYTIGGSNGNYLGKDRAIYINGSKKVYLSMTSGTLNESKIVYIGENVTNVYIGNIKIYRNTGLLFNIVPVMYNGVVEFYDKVNKRFMEITATPPSEYVKTRLTGEKIII